MKKTKPKKGSAKRSGGHNPGATPRKLLEGKSLRETQLAAFQGDLPADKERLAYLICAVRQFELELSKMPEAEASANLAAVGLPKTGETDGMQEGSTYTYEASGIRIRDKPQYQEEARAVVSKCVRQLARWLVNARPEDLEAMARFLRCRPIGPVSFMGLGIVDQELMPKPADPEVFWALDLRVMAVSRFWFHYPDRGPKEGESVTLSDDDYREAVENLSASDRNAFFDKHCPDTADSTRRKIINLALGVVGTSGPHSKA